MQVTGEGTGGCLITVLIRRIDRAIILSYSVLHKDKGSTMAVSPTITVRLPAELIARIDAHAAKLARATGLDVNRSEAVRLLLERGLKEGERKE